MKRKPYLAGICFLMAALMVFFTGCQGNPPEQTIPSTTAAAATGATETAAADPGEFNILNRALTDGKMACFFLKAANDWSAAEEGEYGGESILLIMPDGTTLLCDCETPNNGANIVYMLQQLGITKLDYFVNSHPHIDHMGGFPILARHIEIGQIYVPDVKIGSSIDGTNTPYYRQLLEIVEEKNIPMTGLKAGDTLKIGKDVEVKVFNPLESFDPGTMNYNESSIVMKLTYQDSSFLLGGDAGNSDHLGQKTETLIVEKYGDELKADVAKINHHAEPSPQSTSDAWVQAVQAKIYVGTNSTIPNEMEHFRLLKMAMDTGAQYLHTGIDGTILITTTGDGEYDVYTENPRPTDYYGTLELVDSHMHIQ